MTTKRTISPPGQQRQLSHHQDNKDNYLTTMTTKTTISNTYYFKRKHTYIIHRQEHMKRVVSLPIVKHLLLQEKAHIHHAQAGTHEESGQPAIIHNDNKDNYLTTMTTKRTISPQWQQRELSHHKGNKENYLTTRATKRIISPPGQQRELSPHNDNRNISPQEQQKYLTTKEAKRTISPRGQQRELYHHQGNKENYITTSVTKRNKWQQRELSHHKGNEENYFTTRAAVRTTHHKNYSPQRELLTTRAT